MMPPGLDTAAILSLIADLYGQIIHLQTELAAEKEKKD